MKSLVGLIAEKNIVIKGADLFTEGGFTQVPNVVLRHKNLSPGAKLTYAMLLSYAWHDDYCYPGQERLAEDIGISDRSVRTHLKELEEKGLIKVKQQGHMKTNHYHLDLRAQFLKRG